MNYTPYASMQFSRLPSGMQDVNGEAWGTTLGLMKDVLAIATYDAVLARFIPTAPEDSLQYIGESRGLPRNPNETVDAYRIRLGLAWELWTWAGTKRGLLTALSGLGFSNSRVFERTPCTSDWYKFTVVLYPPHGFSQVRWHVDDGTLCDGGALIGFFYEPLGYPMIRPTVAKWKPAHTMLDSVVLVESGEIVGGEWFIGDGTPVGGETVLV